MQNHYRSTTICLEAINKDVHCFLSLLGNAYIGLESLFPSVVETDALAFQRNVGHDDGYLGACVHVCLVRKPLQNTTAAGATILVTQNSQSNGVWVYRIRRACSETRSWNQGKKFPTVGDVRGY